MNQFKWLKDWWFIIVFIAAILIGWTNMNSKIVDLQLRMTASEVKIAAQDTNQNEIKVQLSQIQTDILWIKQKLSN